MENSDTIINENIIKKCDEGKKGFKCKLFWSIITILSVAISTGYGSQVKYSLLNDNPKHFFPPYTMMWFNNCCLIICFPVYLLYEKFIKKTQHSLGQITRKSAQIFSGEDGFKFSSSIIKELFFLLLYVCGNYSYALALGKITSSAALVVRSFEVSVVYIFGRIVLKDKFNIFKTVAVFLAIIGVIFIALDKEFAANIFGFLLVVFSCVSDSVYKISFKFVAGENASLGEGMLFLSGMAVVNLLFNFLPTAILVYFGYDIWQWEHVPWGNFLNFVFLTFGIDIIFRGRHLTPTFVFGAISLIISAILANFHKQIGNLLLKKGEEKEENVREI